ncbi:MAG: hypothetical protein ABIO70_24610 [Pseudomonadota bacterium]
MVLLMLLCCWLAAAPVRAQQGPDAAAEHARLEQVLLPALAGRRQAAEAREAAAERFFDGEGDWRAAFPELAEAPLGDAGFLRARAWELQGRARARAAEAARPAPEGLPGLGVPDVKAWRRQLSAANAAEERADTLEQRFVSGLEAALVAAPGLSDVAVTTQAASWEAPLQAAEGAQPTEDELALAAAAGRARRDLEALRQAAWRAATVPGDGVLTATVGDQLDPVPDPLPAGLAERLALLARIDRLQRAAPLLPSALAGQVDDLATALERGLLLEEKAAMEAAPGDAADAGAGLGVESLERQVQELQQRLVRAREDLEHVVEQATPAPMREDVAQLRVWLAEKRLATRTGALERARRLATTGLTGGNSDERVAQARRDADLARQAVDDEGTRATEAEMALRQEVATRRQEIAALVEQERARSAESQANIEALGLRLQEQSDALAAALALPPLDRERRSQMDSTYLALRGLVDDLRATLQRHAAARATLHTDRAHRLARLDRPVALPEGLTSETISDLLAQVQAADGDVRRALDERGAAVDRELDALLDLLTKARVQRRIARGEASGGARQAITRAFLPELVAEGRELNQRALASLRHTGPWLRSLPDRLLDLSALWLLAAGSFELLLLALAWLWLRRAAPAWTAGLVESAHAATLDREQRGLGRLVAEAAGRWLEPGPLLAMAGPWADLTRALVDLIAAWLVARVLSHGAPIIALTGWLLAAAITWRALPGLFPALLASPGEGRPALRTVAPATRERLLGLVRAIVAWWLALSLGHRLALGLLGADRLDDLVGTLGSLAFWAVALVQVHGWGPTLKAALGDPPEGRLATWASQPASRWPLALLQGLTALLLLAGRLLTAGAVRVSGTGSRLSWIAALVARRQLGDAAEAHGEPLPEALTRDLLALRPLLPGVSATLVELTARHAAWLGHRAQGLRVLTAARGMGKSELLTRWARALGPEATVLTPPEGLDDPARARAWLATATLGEGADATWSRDDLIARIGALPGPRAFLVDTMERLFLREVGGFAALHAVLEVMHATSDEHFWVCGFHGPTWAYLRGVPQAFDPATFTEVHQIQAAAPEAIAHWLGTVAQQSGHELSFTRLSAVPASAPEADRAQRRARAAYWRLLHDKSGGNPAVARQLWLEGLSLEGDTLSVGLSQDASPGELRDLADNELFVLTAVLVHDRLGVDALARALNLPEGGVRTACQRLAALGLLERTDASSPLHVPLRWLPATERHLRLKNFLHTR